MKAAFGSRSLQIYLGLIAVLIMVRVLFIIVPVTYIIPAQAGAFTWPALILIAVLGLLGLWAASRTNFPELWDPKVTNRQRFLVPAGLGIVAGLVFLVLGRLQPLGEINVPFPLSIPYYLYGGIVSEILYRLFIIPVPVWFISGVLLKQRGQEVTFWSVVVVVSLLEPLGQLGAMYQLGLLQNGVSPVLGILIVLVYVFNLVAAYLFRKYGFVAPVVLRLAHYLVWHLVG
ncbi:MAG: hypothetical protein ABIG63_09975 [Chloroflexota bacterium]